MINRVLGAAFENLKKGREQISKNLYILSETDDVLFLIRKLRGRLSGKNRRGAATRAPDSPESRIIGGKNASIEKYPFAVSITCARSSRAIWHLENRCVLSLSRGGSATAERRRHVFWSRSRAFLQK